jgi:hypothetical protein
MAHRRTHGLFPGIPLCAPITCCLIACCLVGCASTHGVARVSQPSPAAPRPSALRSTSPGLPSAPPTAPPTVAPSPPTSPVAALPSFADSLAVSCAGYPTPGQVITLLRTQQVIARSVAVTVDDGPLCAGDWQFTALSVAGLGSLQIISQGRPERLKLITAGTAVCTPLVRTQAPPGIISVARC